MVMALSIVEQACYVLSNLSFNRDADLQTAAGGARAFAILSHLLVSLPNWHQPGPGGGGACGAGQQQQPKPGEGNLNEIRLLCYTVAFNLIVNCAGNLVLLSQPEVDPLLQSVMMVCLFLFCFCLASPARSSVSTVCRGVLAHRLLLVLRSHLVFFTRTGCCGSNAGGSQVSGL
jgi:hypothetical protein